MPVWEHVETKNGDGASNTISFTGLAGNTAKEYRIIGMYASSSDAALLYCRLNGDTANDEQAAFYDNAGTWADLGTGPDAQIFPVMSATNDDSALIIIDIFADAGPGWERGYWCVAVGSTNSTGEQFSGNGWADTTTELTSIDLILSTAENFRTSSVWRLYKLANP